jgi:Lon protease-like protein
MPTDQWIPLFPLNTVLFPLGILPLRVFEPRYIDMVRNCLKQDAPFGVVLISKGSEVGEAAETTKIGCLAHIRHWDMQDFGVLLLQTQGGTRFRILATRETADHRLEAQVEMLADDMPTLTGAVHDDITNTLQKVINEVQEQGETEQGETFLYPFPLPTQLDDAGWVAHRWTEILPLALTAKQRLLAIDDPLMRLQAVEEHLTELGVIGELNLPLSNAHPTSRVLH